MYLNTIYMKNVRLLLKDKFFSSYAWIGAIIIIIVNLAFSSLYFTNTFPLSEGWFVNYSELILRGKVPYKDFYYFLPPFTLFFDTILWKLSFGLLIVFRGWYLFERILIYLLVYRFLCRYFKWQYAAISCTISEILCAADAFDFFGDYNQNIVLLVVLFAYCAANFTEEVIFKSKLKHLFLAGVLLGFMFLCKQTIVLSCFIIYLFALIINCYLNKDKNLFRYIIFVALGTLIPIICFFIYLSYHNAIVPFIDQVFLSASGKGSFYDIIIKMPLETIQHLVQWVLSLVLFLMILIVQKENIEKAYIRILLIISILLIASKFNFLKYINAVTSSYKFIGLIIVAAIPLILTHFLRNKISHCYILRNIFIFLWIGCIGAGLYLSDTTLLAIYEMDSFSIIESLFNVTLYYYQFLFIGYCIAQKLYKGKQQRQYESLFMFAAGGLAICYASSMAAGSNTIASLAMRITTPLIICHIIQVFSFNRFTKTVKYFFYGFCTILITITCAQKAISPYPWWGIDNSPMWEKTYTVDIPELKGITFSKDDKDMYERITQLIKENSNEDDIIFGYPYIKIFNILCHRYETNFVPVMWYDVVGDQYVELTIQEFEKKLPEIVLWKEIPGAMEAHENIYRNGQPLVQRKLEKMFQKILPKKYELLDTVNGISVYKLKQDF